jgi:hypothetical protein
VTGEGKAERDRARAALTVNLFVLPGLGSLLMGRRAGWLQAPLALGGMALSVRWLALVLRDWWRAGALPASVPYAGLLLEGAGLFALAWLWALATSRAILRRAGAGDRDQGKGP